MFQNEGHDQIHDQMQPNCNETEVDERKSHLLGLDVELLTPPVANAEKLAFQSGFGPIDHHGFLSNSAPMTQDKQ
mgnify:FL=1